MKDAISAWDSLGVLDGATRASAERIDTGRGTTTLFVDAPAGPRWLRFEDGAWNELDPLDDERLPLAVRLRAAGHAREEVRVLAYRPGRRLVVRLAGDEERIYKGTRKGRSEPASAAHRSAEAAGGFAIPPLLEHDEPNATLVFGFIRGETLRLVTDATDELGRIGAALREFQEARVEFQREPFGLERELAVLDTWSERVEGLRGRLPRGWSSARDELREHARSTPAPALGLCHRDLHDGQFLVTPGRPTLLDFDLLTHADVALDPANLCAHLHLRALQGQANEDAAVQLERAFLGGLDRADDPGFDQRFTLYLASSYLRLALVYSVRPRWTELPDPLTRLGRNALRLLTA